MKSCMFLIILLSFIRIIICTQIPNVTEEHVCPVSWFRRKRANGDYTRWRWNMETTPEFIVKVLDDESLIGTTNKLVGVNILPQSKRIEKIIVGGVSLPTTTTPSVDMARDYTRFMPPTIGSSELVRDDVIVSIRKDTAPFLPPVMAQSALRDESPPAGPQFLPRSRLRAQDGLPTQLYAPIAPVAFTRHSTDTSPTSRLYDNYNLNPTRILSTLKPTRTRPLRILDKLDEYPFFEAIAEDSLETKITRTSPKGGKPSRTHGLKTVPPDYEIDDFFTTLISTKRSQDATSHSELGEEGEIELSQRKDVTDDDDNKETNHITFHNTDENDNRSDAYVGQEDDFEIKNNTPGDMRFRSKLEPDYDVDGVLHRTEMEKVTVDVQDTDVSVDTDEFNNASLDSVPKRSQVCNIITLKPLNFKVPPTLPEIVHQLKAWTNVSPVAKLAEITGGRLTTMENPIYIIIVDDPSGGQVASEKQNTLLVAGIHGRDHHAVTSAMYILYQLIEHSELHRDILKKYRFWVIPVFNPDGYDYSMTFPNRRDWAKNLRQTWDPCNGRESCKLCSSIGIRCTVASCYGVNLDRNFEYQWIPPAELRADQPCGDLYGGARQMSEVETQSLEAFLLEQHIPISLFIAFKEGDVLGVMYPYSHTKKTRAFDQKYRQRAKQAASAASSIAGRTFVAGQTSEFFPLYAGGIEDWADGHLGVDSSYSVILFLTSNASHPNLLKERVIHEAYTAMHSLLLSNLEQAKMAALTLTRSEASTLHPKILAFLIFFLLSQFVT